jgi:hypothetical protein
MTLKQFRRMKVFALRMIKIMPKHHRKALKDHVPNILSHMDCENFSLHYSQIIDWDHSVDWTKEEEAADPSRRHYSKNRLMCDWVGTEYGEYDSTLTRERENSDGDYATSLRGSLQCVIRAALDVGASPSAGVVGYTVGDLRKMWAPRPIPKWVIGFFKGDITKAADDMGVWL